MMTPSSEMTTSSTPSPETLGLATGSLDSNSKTSSALLTPEQALAGKFSGPLKREYVMRKCVMPPQSELEPIETFVWNAIQSKHVDAPDPVHEQGYRAIIDALKRPVDPPMLRMVLIALRTAGNGTVQNQLTTNAVQHAQLIHWIFRFNSAFCPNLAEDNENEQLFSVFKDGSLLDAHLHLVLAMVSCRTVNLVPALTAVWRMLSEDSELSEDFQQRLHAMLYSMMRLVPKARSELLPIIAARFPFWKASKQKLMWYCVQSFQVLDYLPSIRKALLELVIDKCLEIDVNIKINDNGEVLVEEEVKEEEENANNGGGNSEVPSPQELSVSVNDVDQLSDTLDSLLALLMRMMNQGCNDGQGAREFYYEILPVFESTIITSHKSKFVQYCLFYLCGLESERTGTNPASVIDASSQEHSILHRDFASKLLEIVVDPYRAMLTRQSAACYLASFVSRASYVEAETICESISTLLRWAEAYMDSLTFNSIFAADAREQSELHGLFYTVCQAAFYIMCFRGTDAMSFYREALTLFNKRESMGGDDMHLLPDPNDIDLGASRWTRICNHDLQPLRFCLESVRSEFLHVAHFYALIEEQVLDKLVIDAKRMSTGRVNKKAASTIRTAATLEKQRRKGGVGGLGRGSNPLKSFFPFDPLLLRRSHLFVEPFYRNWQGPVEEEDVLVIDEAPDDEDDQIFDMDEDEDGSDSDDEEDEVPVVVSDQETKEEPDSDSDGAEVDECFTASPAQTKHQQKKIWTETMKRPRSQSMENGSW